MRLLLLKLDSNPTRRQKTWAPSRSIALAYPQTFWSLLWWTWMSCCSNMAPLRSIRMQRQDQYFSLQWSYFGYLTHSIAHLDLQVFNHLANQFGSMLRNHPEKFFPDYISTGTYVKYSFKAFGAIVILCIEMEFHKLPVDAGRLDAIAKIITECESTLHIV